MRQLLLGGAVIGLFAATMAFSRKGPTRGRSARESLAVKVEDRNPWTNLRLNNDPADFHFAIVSDRTGGHRAGVFSQAVEQLNLLQPEFVVSVGDLIEGYTQDRPSWPRASGRSSRATSASCRCRSSTCPATTTSSNAVERQGLEGEVRPALLPLRLPDVLFLMLNTDDPPGQGDGGIEQRSRSTTSRRCWTTTQACAGRSWSCTGRSGRETSPDRTAGWTSRRRWRAGKYTVFCGHIHRYQKFVRKGMNYYQLATTGGGSKMRGVRYGEFDHIVWVTMKKTGPVLANMMLDGIYPERFAGARDRPKNQCYKPDQDNISRSAVHPFRRYAGRGPRSRFTCQDPAAKRTSSPATPSPVRRFLRPEHLRRQRRRHRKEPTS